MPGLTGHLSLRLLNRPKPPSRPTSTGRWHRSARQRSSGMPAPPASRAGRSLPSPGARPPAAGADGLAPDRPRGAGPQWNWAWVSRTEGCWLARPAASQHMASNTSSEPGGLHCANVVHSACICSFCRYMETPSAIMKTAGPDLSAGSPSRCHQSASARSNSRISWRSDCQGSNRLRSATTGPRSASVMCICPLSSHWK